MTNVLALLLTCVLTACCTIGCGPPVVTIRHVLPAAVPLPPDVATLRAGEVAVTAGTKNGCADFVTQQLRQRLPRVLRDRQGTGAAHVSGRIRIQRKDTTGSRVVRTRDPKTRTLRDRTVPTLVRTASVRVTFLLARAGTGEALGGVEVRRSYRSSEDPRTRGPLGLERADHPQRVPPAGQVVREMLAACVETFCEMLAPVPLTVEVPLRPVLHPRAAAAMAAARAQNWAKAIEGFEAVLAERADDPNVLFDLAVVREASGELDAALDGYRKVLAGSEQQDKAAAEGTRRVRRARTKP